MGVILDISKWQDTPDFAKLSNLYKSGAIDGVLIRVQHGYTTPDEKYAANVAGCKQYGIPFGTYAYFAGISVNDSIAEANSAFQRTDKDSKCFALDIEEVTMSDLVAGGQAYIDRLRSLGMNNLGLYSGEYFYDAHNLAAIRCDWTWIARYNANDGSRPKAPNVAGIDLWQFCSTAHVDGISTNVDESVVTDPNGFPFFGQHVIVSQAPQFLMTVRILNDTDVRTSPDHASGFIRNATKGQLYNVAERQGDWLHVAVTDNMSGWIDSAGGSNAVDVRTPAPAPAAPITRYHTVVRGDTVSALAVANGTTIHQIAVWNNINPDRIFVGQKLRVS